MQSKKGRDIVVVSFWVELPLASVILAGWPMWSGWTSALSHFKFRVCAALVSIPSSNLLEGLALSGGTIAGVGISHSDDQGHGL